jgi:cytochrome c oxidase subunit IV
MAEVVPQRIYYRVFAALLALTLLTWGVSYVHFGGYLGIIVALTIATVKTALVVLYFMHVRYSNRLIWVYIGAGIFWFVLLVGVTMGDYISRPWLPISEGWQRLNVPDYAPHPTDPPVSQEPDRRPATP